VLLQTGNENVIGYFRAKADGSTVDLQQTLAPRIGTYYISFNSRIQSHRRHAGTNFSVTGYFTYLDATSSRPVRKWCHRIATSLSAKAVPYFVSEAATTIFPSSANHCFLQ